MITTATTATTATTTTATTAATMSPEALAVFGVVAVLLLIGLMITKELAVAADHPRAQRLNKAVNIAIVPLFMTFGAITFAKVTQILN